MAVTLTIKGIQEAQQRNQRQIAALRPAGAFGAAVREATVQLQRYSIALTHVDTGALKSSHTMEVKALWGRIFISPSAVNPHGGLPARYGPFEHARGGDHAFYDRAVAEYGQQVIDRATAKIAVAVENA
ncbi:MAG TPA: hypothetical protein VL334_24305 [Anaerolineae bacterium]|nr:hypothetical protein [Anaerolineae bacterium]